MQICKQRAYLFARLNRQGLPQEQLQCEFYAIIVSRLLYAAHDYDQHSHISF